MIDAILRHRRLILAVFAALTLAAATLMPLVGVDYDMISFLPEDSPSTIALHKMTEVFGALPDTGARVMAPNVTIAQALDLKARMAALEGVSDVRWLDDQADTNVPVEFIDQALQNEWYKDAHALFAVWFTYSEDGSQTAATVEAIRALADGIAVSGGEIDAMAAKQSTGPELTLMIALIVPLTLLIMMLATRSWAAPLLFILVIGVAIVLNMGTNAFLGNISFVTAATSAILQLAVSMDYSIFLLHAFEEFRAQGLAPRDAMKRAMKKAFPSVVASGLTTVLGFLALMLMRFRLGFDLGLVLAKGVAFSLLCVVLLLPHLTLLCLPLIDKSAHRSFVPDFSGFGRLVVKIGVPVVAVVLALVVPLFLAQSRSEFVYGSSVMTADEQSVIGRDAKAINAVFGETNQLVLLLPERSDVTEAALAEQLLALPHVDEVISYVTSVGREIPFDTLAAETAAQLRAGGYSRFVIELSAAQESDEAFQAVAHIRDAAAQHYGDEYYLSGGSVNVYDLRAVVRSDNPVVNTAAILGIGLVVLLTFRSLSLPVLLLLAIQFSIWANLSVPYFLGNPLAYIGYMIISAVQLGATVDYAILYAGYYLEKRKLMPRRQAAGAALAEAGGSIVTSAGILCAAGIVVSVVSTNGVVAALGELLGRGAALSAVVVLFFLPSALVVCDRLVLATTMRMKESAFRPPSGTD